MKEKTSIKTIASLLSLVGLAVLLILSPCKVRNFIQQELGIQQTEVSNKNKTTISLSNCVDTEITTDNFTLEKNSFSQQLIATKTGISTSFIATDFSYNHTPSYVARKHTSATIPLYILYQNFKNYL
ncbi:hypothetical protein [Mangrovimonas spongiae]|uniref:Uncharacterized protein n=1 Tax=Mangrovimonas spongiae TaxID=2494697 RepID=A0A428K0A6_9FLAO|nr:hypothetical protein [Mangrovimonas spongiae]RSK39860.1 hypothetical protein EJA19_08235 [Mangrovimonas spongiae]